MLQYLRRDPADCLLELLTPEPTPLKKSDSGVESRVYLPRLFVILLILGWIFDSARNLVRLLEIAFVNSLFFFLVRV